MRSKYVCTQASEVCFASLLAWQSDGFSAMLIPWLTGGPLMLIIIIKLLTMDNKIVDLLSVPPLFTRLKPLSHSLLQGMVCLHRMSGFRLLGSMYGCSRKSLIPLTAWSSQRLNRLHSRVTCDSPYHMPGADGQLLVSRMLRSQKCFTFKCEALLQDVDQIL